MQDIVNFINQHPGLVSAVALTCLLLMVIEFIRLKRQMSGLTPQEAITKINHEQAMVVDIRDKAQYAKSHIIDSINIPHQDLLDQPKKLDKYKNKPIIIVCNNGQDSTNIAKILNQKGYRTFALSGGLLKWKAAEMPFIKE